MRSCAPPWDLPRRAMACTSVPRVRSSRPAIAGWIGRRTRCIREKEAHSASFLALIAEARIPKGSGPFSFLTQPACASAQASDRWIAPPLAVDALKQVAARQPRYWPMACLAPFADVAQLAERGHAMAEATSSRLVIRSTSGVSMHSEATRHGVGGPGCARSLARPRAARHHIRRDARVWAQPKWIHALVAQQAEQPPCKRQAARSNRRRGTTRHVAFV